MIHGVFKNRVLKSLHRSVNLAAHNGHLDFLDEYNTKFIKGFFQSGPFVFQLSRIYDLKDINKDCAFLKERLSPDLVPFAKNERGDRLAIHCETGHIYLWELDKDLLTNKNHMKESRVANSFTDFSKRVSEIAKAQTQADASSHEFGVSDSVKTFLSKLLKKSA